MSPFAETLRALRMQHGLRQGDLAQLLGCDRGKISALENDLRESVSEAFVADLVTALSLSAQEYEHLLTAMRESQRSYLVPVDAPPKAYRLAHELFLRLDTLPERQIDALRLVLKLHQGESPSPTLTRSRLHRKDRHTRRESVP